MREEYDLLIIGGGVNGAGIARDAAGRGLSVLLCEKEDLSGGTSSRSTKLIHGGLRYLEHYEFGLVREALIEREVLLRSAPHIIWPLQFILPHNHALRPAWMIRLGLLLYDHLGKRKLLPGSTRVDLRNHATGVPLKPGLRDAFAYFDCWVQDARLVVLNALDAAERGADIATRTECLSARRNAGFWQATLRSALDGSERTVQARCLVNAAGPWVGEVLNGRIGVNSEKRVRLVGGSHIVVPKCFEHDCAYIFQHSDRRIVFAIPYEQRFTLIGTTEEEFEGDDPGTVSISPREVDYLCGAVNSYFEHPVRPEDVIWSYSGVRPLFDDASDNASEVTREYELELDAPLSGGAPALSVYGGKITTYRKLAEHALRTLSDQLTVTGGAWTAAAPLPGGDMPNADFDAFLADFSRAHPWVPATLAWRYARNYGTRAERVLGAASKLGDLGESFGADLYEAEVEYLRRHEWAMTADDVLWRRSKLGLHLPADRRAVLEDWFARTQSAHRASTTVDACPLERPLGHAE